MRPAICLLGLAAALAFIAPALARQDTPAAAPTTVAAADGKAAADSCAKALPSDSRMIYDATVKAMKDGSTLRDVVTAQTRSLVMSGKIQRDNARPAAEAAGTCLKMLSG